MLDRRFRFEPLACIVILGPGPARNKGLSGQSLASAKRLLFAETEGDFKAVLASHEKYVLVDGDGSVVSYSSFQEAGSLAQEVLDNMLEMGGVMRFRSWEGVVDNFRSESRVSKMEGLVHYVRKLNSTTFKENDVPLFAFQGWMGAGFNDVLAVLEP